MDASFHLNWLGPRLLPVLNYVAALSNMELAFACSPSFAGRALVRRQSAFPSTSGPFRASKLQSFRRRLHPQCSDLLKGANNFDAAAGPSQGSPWSSAILLVDHGSKRAAANDMLCEVRDTVEARLGAGAIVHIAHMELAEPTIMEGFTKCIADGANHIVVVPFFLAPGRHCTTDIPAMVKDAAKSFPGSTYEVREHLGTHPALVDAVLDRVANLKI